MGKRGGEIKNPVADGHQERKVGAVVVGCSHNVIRESPSPLVPDAAEDISHALNSYVYYTNAGAAAPLNTFRDARLKTTKQRPITEEATPLIVCVWLPHCLYYAEHKQSWCTTNFMCRRF
jgi:hypothetical protein